MSSVEFEINRKKPAIAYVVQAIAVLSVLSNILEAIFLLMAFGKFPRVAAIGTLLVCVLFATASARVFLGFGVKRFSRRFPVSIYLWAMLFLYPVINIFRSHGLYVPAARLQDNELAGAALVEIGRYIIFLALIVWASMSKKLAKFLSVSQSLINRQGGQLHHRLTPTLGVIEKNMIMDPPLDRKRKGTNVKRT